MRGMENEKIPEEVLSILLGHAFSFGILANPKGNKDDKALLNACLELENRGLVKRERKPNNKILFTAPS
jgi:hypothetical protein